MENEKYPYQKEWEDYNTFNPFGCFLLIPIIILFVFLRQYQFFVDYGVFFIIGIIAFFFFFNLYSDRDFKCPRCKGRFEYSKERGRTEYCISCGLPVYFGSSRFYDYWGTERGNKLIEKVSKENIL